MNVYELISFILYFIVVLGVGIYFFIKGKDKSEKDYFLGGREMGGWVSALSAGASDMSAWVLMGLPGAIFIAGLSQVWISVGLLVGTVLAWIFVAPKLRRFAIKANDSITIPQFFTNRFLSDSKILSVTCAIVFVVGYCLYSASSVFACGRLVNLLIPEIPQYVAMIVSAVVIVIYTLLGGFKAVCWTDFIQGMIMLVALMAVPVISYIVLQASGSLSAVSESANYYSFLATGKFDWESVATILTGLGWGLGYFGMPHILVRYMAIKSEKEMKKSQIIGSTWTFLILLMATFVGLIAHEYLGSSYESDKEMVFVNIVRSIFNYGPLALLGGILISAIVAASMSTADSQLLASSSAFATDIYKSTLKPDAKDKEMLWVGRIAVGVITVIALAIALLVYFYDLTDIMGLVSAAWSIFGATFGPVILLCLFWKRLNYTGTCAGIITGFAVSVLWMILFNFEYYGFDSVIINTNLYEIIPGFIMGLVVSIVVSLFTKKPDEKVIALFNSVE